MAEASTIARQWSSHSGRPIRCLLGLHRWVLESQWDTGWATDRRARCALKRVRKDSAS